MDRSAGALVLIAGTMPGGTGCSAVRDGRLGARIDCNRGRGTRSPPELLDPAHQLAAGADLREGYRRHRSHAPNPKKQQQRLDQPGVRGRHPDDVQGLATQVLAHRLLPTVEASMSGRTTEAALRHILAGVPMPESRRRG